MRRLLLAVLVVTVTACASAPPPDAAGADIYDRLCVRCHGEELQGVIGPPLGSGSEAADRSDEYLVMTITRGKGSRMPSFGATLSDEQVSRVVAYLREQQG